MSGVTLALIAIAFVLSAFGQGPIAPSGPPAPAMRTLDQLDTAIAQTSAKIDALAAQTRAERFTAAHELASSGAIVCKPIEIPAGKFVKLESVVAHTSGSTAPVAFFYFTVRVGAGGRGVHQRIPLTAVGGESGEIRTGNVQIPIWVRGGNLSESQLGEATSLNVCVDPPTGDAVAANFFVSGVYE